MIDSFALPNKLLNVSKQPALGCYTDQIWNEKGEQALAHVHILNIDHRAGYKILQQHTADLLNPKDAFKTLAYKEALHIHCTTIYYLCTHVANMSHAFRMGRNQYKIHYSLYWHASLSHVLQHSTSS